MKVYSGKSFDKIYERLLYDLIYHPEYVSKPRNLTVNENINSTIILENPYNALFKNNRRSSKKNYLLGELEWYFSGRNDLEFIKDYAKFWNNIANDDGTINSAYGYLLFKDKLKNGLSQYNYVINLLINDIDTRQAIMHLNNKDHMYFGNKDFVCTMYTIFNIRNNKLNLTTHMRSNDVILGLPNDLPFYCLLLIQAYKHLSRFYPNLQLGTYTHIVNSLHLYQNNFTLVDEMVNDVFYNDYFNDFNEDLISITGSNNGNLNNKLKNILRIDE